MAFGVPHIKTKFRRELKCSVQVVHLEIVELYGVHFFPVGWAGTGVEWYNIDDVHCASTKSGYT